MKKLILQEQSGRSMVEMLGVLAIIGVLSVGGISGYSKAMAKYKLTKAQDQISMMLINIRTAFASSPSYDQLTNETAILLNIIPGDMLPDGIGDTNGSVINAFSGSVKIATGTVDGGSNTQHFTIEFGGLGKETCASLAASDWGTEGLVSMKVNSSTKKDQSDLPINAIEAANLCNLDDSANKIIWEYY